MDDQKNKYISYFNNFENLLKNIEQNNQNQLDLQQIFDYSCSLIKNIIRKELNEQNQQQVNLTFEYDKIEEYIEEIQKLIQNNNDPSQDLYHIFQQLKWNIIQLVKRKENIYIEEIVDQLKKIQFFIKDNNNWRFHYNFLEILVNLIQYDSSFCFQEKKQDNQIADNTNQKFEQLSKYLKTYIQKDYFERQCEQAIKSFLDLTFKENQYDDEFLLENIEDQKIEKKDYNTKLSCYKQTRQNYFSTDDEQDNLDFKKINVPLRVKINNNQQPKDLFEEFDIDAFSEIKLEAEINNFLWNNKNQNDILLIKGLAGSGKSKILQQLELFLWNIYDSQLKIKKWIPLYYKLQDYEKTSESIFNQILITFPLVGDELFIFQQDVIKGEKQIILLLDGYDEMKQQFQAKYLIKDKEYFKKQLGKNVKIIITSRKESLNDEKYKKDFTGTSEKNLIEAEIIEFDELQINQYLEQHSVEMIRQKLYEDYKKIFENTYDNFQEIWQAFLFEDIKQIVLKTENLKSKQIFSNKLILEKLHKKLNIIYEFESLSSKNDLDELFESMKRFQSQSQLKRKIQNNHIKNLIKTPQAFKIILNILTDESQLELIKTIKKNKFLLELAKVKQQQIKMNDQILNENDFVENLKELFDNTPFFDDFEIEHLQNEKQIISENDLLIIKSAVKLSNITLYEFYKLYIKKYHEEQKEKLQKQQIEIEIDFKSKLNKCQIELAIIMNRNEKYEFTQKKLRNEGFKTFEFKHDNEYPTFFKCGLIKLIKEDKLGKLAYSFQHKSIQEFFVGKYILWFIKKFETLNDQEILNSDYNKADFDLNKKQFEVVIDFIKEDLLNFENIKENLIKIVKLSKKKGYEFAASNSIFLINYLGMELIGEDLSGIELDGTNISGLNFFGSNLDQSKFSKVQLYYCNFNNTSLLDVEWTTIPYNIVTLKEENRKRIEGMIFSPDGNFLIYWIDNLVYIRNQKTEIIKKIKQPQGLKQCIFSSDSTKFLLQSQEFIMIYRFVNNDIILLMCKKSYFPYLQCLTFFNKEEQNLIILNKEYYNEETAEVINLKAGEKKIIQIEDLNKIIDYEDVNITTFTINGQNDVNVLLGTKDGSILKWNKINNKPEQLFNDSINTQQSQILQIEFSNLGQQTVNNDVLISISEDQVNIWLKKEGKYQIAKSLPYQKVNGKLPRYVFSQQNELILITKDQIIFYDIQNNYQVKQNKIVILKEECQEIVYINYQFLIQRINSHTYQIKELQEMTVIKEFQFNIFAIIEYTQYLAFETMDKQIFVYNFCYLQNQKIEFIDQNIRIKIDTQQHQTHLVWSPNGDYLLSANNQQINVYLIYSHNSQLQSLEILKIKIDLEVKMIQISDSEQIGVLSQNRFTLYELYQVHKNKLPKEIKKYYMNYRHWQSIKLNFTNKLLAICCNEIVLFLERSEINSFSLKSTLKAKFFSSSIDNKKFAILNEEDIYIYDFDWQNGFKSYPKIPINNAINIKNLLYVKDNQLVVIFPNEIYFQYGTTNDLNSIQGVYDQQTQVSLNDEVAVSENSNILITKKQTQPKLYNKDDFGYCARNPCFTQDGEYIAFEKINDPKSQFQSPFHCQIVFQSLSNPQIKFIHSLQNKQEFTAWLLPYSNYYVTQDYYFIYIWDASVLNDIKLLRTIPQDFELFQNVESFQNCSDFPNQILFTKKNIQDIIKDCHDTLLIEGYQVQAGLFKDETQFYTVKDNIISIKNIKTKTQEQQILDHQANIISIDFSEDGKFMASSDINDRIVIWNTLEQKKLIINNQQNNDLDKHKNYEIISKCIFVKLSHSLGITYLKQNEVLIYDFKDFNQPELFYKISADPQFIFVDHYIYSNDNKLAIITQEKYPIFDDHEIIIFELKTKQQIQRLLVYSPHFSQNYKENTIQIFISNECYLISQLQGQTEIKENELIWMKEYDFYKKKKQKRGMIEEITNQQNNKNLIKKPLLEQHMGRTEDLELVYVGNKYILYTFEQKPCFKQYRIIDLELREKQMKIIGFCRFQKYNKLNCLQLQNDRLIYKHSDDNKWHLFNFQNNSEEQIEHSNENRFQLAISNNGQYLGYGWNDRDIQIYNQDKNEIFYQHMKNQKVKDNIKINLIFFNDDKMLISSYDNELKFWNIKLNKLIQQINFDQQIASIVISPEESNIALELQNGEILPSQDENGFKYGCYKSIPQLQQLSAMNCKTSPKSVIQDEQENSLITVFDHEQQFRKAEQNLQDQ
ncbi:unnamed protein product [Paramecium sonneborni]|uniref:NACHT domain-containing protein n=1 Tax=Paramecium sonneborni TaxID=65129 RepID=A0A8S1PR20_9CILI|nr:unnamed protein product [Paramecium sonneborni]